MAHKLHIVFKNSAYAELLYDTPDDVRRAMVMQESTSGSLTAPKMSTSGVRTSI